MFLHQKHILMDSIGNYKALQQDVPTTSQTEIFPLQLIITTRHHIV